MIDSFFNTQILVSGVSPHILFSCVLFSYFAEDVKWEIAPHFKQVRGRALYDNIFLRLEECDAVDWSKHMDVASVIIDVLHNSRVK